MTDDSRVPTPARRRRPSAPVVIALTTLVLFEATLQVAAFALWVGYRQEPEPPLATQHVVLCVGDSYTFGIGATSSGQSYPGHLERLLRTESPTWQVVNAGWPGRNSREVLSMIGGELGKTRPSLVYILVGTNDYWTRPERFDSRVTVEPRTFPWRWRTARLGALIASAGREWVARVRRQSIAAVADAGPGPRADGTSDTASPANPPKRAHSPEEVRALAIAQSARAFASAGRRTEATAELARLRDALEASGSSEAVGEAFAATAVEVGEGDQALAVAKTLAARYPGNPDFFRVIAWESYLKRDQTAALEAITQAITLAQKYSDRKRDAFLLRIRTLILFDQDRRGALESGVAAFLNDGDRRELGLLFQRDVPTYSPALLERILETLHVDERSRQEIRTVHAQARSSSADVSSVLGFHLEQTVAHIHAMGFRAVLLSYPFPSPANRVARQVASEMGAGWIDVETEFANRLTTTRREDLFVADGHLNDRGYSIVAELVSRDVEYRLLGAPPPPRPKAVWAFDVRGAGNAAELSTSEDGKLTVSIQSVTTPNLWDIQLRWPKLSLRQGTMYEVMFTVRADAERQMAFGVNTHEYRSMGLFEQISVGPVLQNVRQSFVAQSSDTDAELHFDLGRSAISVELTDIVMRSLPDGALVEPNGPSPSRQ